MEKMTLLIEKEYNGGTQKIYRFPNGYGASVVRHQFSYGNERGLWELAVIKFENENSEKFTLSCDTDVTDDVEGYLNQHDVDALLSQIENIEPCSGEQPPMAGF